MSELQAGTVDGVDDLSPSGFETVDGDVSLVLGPRKGLNVVSLGFTPSGAPFNNQAVRRALALGIDRGKIVDARFPPSSEVPTHYTPCDIPFGCAGTPWYGFDPALGRETLAAAGYPQGFETTIHYPMTARPSLPDPQGVAIDLQTQLQDNLGITASLVAEPDATYAADVDAGKIRGIFLDTQTVTYPDVSAFLDPTFGPGASAALGKPLGDVVKALATGTWNGGPGQAGSRVRPGQQRHPGPRPDDPARADRLHGGVPRRRRRSARLAAPSRSGSRR